MNIIENPPVAVDYLLTLALWIASLLQLAVVRDWTVRESRSGESYRWLLCAGLAGLALRFTFVLIDAGELAVPLQSMMSMLAMAIGLIGLALEKILTRPSHETPPPNRRAEDWVPGVAEDAP